ncbi:unnamed protein product, partial [Symbiodinium sp. KB8]
MAAAGEGGGPRGTALLRSLRGSALAELASYLDLHTFVRLACVVSKETTAVLEEFRNVWLTRLQLDCGHIPPSLRGRGRGRKGRKRKGSASAAETGHQVAQLYWERLAALLAERQALGADFDLAVFSWAHPQSLMQGRSYEAAAGAAKGKAPQPIFGPVRGILSCALTDQLTCTAGQWPTDPREPQAIAARGAVATGGYVVPFEE